MIPLQPGFSKPSNHSSTIPSAVQIFSTSVSKKIRVPKFDTAASNVSLMLLYLCVLSYPPSNKSIQDLHIYLPSQSSGGGREISQMEIYKFKTFILSFTDHFFLLSQVRCIFDGQRKIYNIVLNTAVYRCLIKKKIYCPSPMYRQGIVVTKEKGGKKGNGQDCFPLEGQRQRTEDKAFLAWGQSEGGKNLQLLRVCLL